MNDSRITTIESGHRIQLPSDWAESLGLEVLATLEKTAEGILIRPMPEVSWDEIFAKKLSIGVAPPSLEEVEVNSDDLLF